MGDKKSRRATVFGREIFVVKSERDPRLLVHEIVQRQICTVVTVGMHESVGSIGFYICKHRIERNPFPRCAEFRPSCNTVQISGELLGWQVAKRLPIPSPQNVSPFIDRKFPSVERHVWRRSRGQDGEVSSEVLPWRQLHICRAASTRKAS